MPTRTSFDSFTESSVLGYKSRKVLLELVSVLHSLFCLVIRHHSPHFASLCSHLEGSIPAARVKDVERQHLLSNSSPETTGGAGALPGRSVPASRPGREVDGNTYPWEGLYGSVCPTIPNCISSAFKMRSPGRLQMTWER